MDWKTPIAMAATYAVVIHTLNPKSSKASRVEAKNKGIKDVSKKSGPLMTAFVFLHNLSLAIYSGVTFVNMAIALHKSVHRDLPFSDIVSTTTSDQIFDLVRRGLLIWFLSSSVIRTISFGTMLSDTGVIFSISPSTMR
jgi:hypothetical protein